MEKWVVCTQKVQIFRRYSQRIWDRSGDRKTDQEQGCRRNMKISVPIFMGHLKELPSPMAFERHGQSSGDPSGKNIQERQKNQDYRGL